MRTLIYLGFAVASAFSVSANAQSENLSSWQVDGDGLWSYNNETNSWYQGKNTALSTFLYDPSSVAIGKAISGQISIDPNGDDDNVGFAVGYEAGDATNADADYWLVSWRSGAQGTWDAGMSLWHVTGALNSYDLEDPENHPALEFISKGKTLGDTKWETEVDYTFDVTYNTDSLGVFVQDQLQFGFTANDVGVDSFDNGGFAFFNFSQDKVNYKNVQYDDIDKVLTEDKKEQLANSVPVHFGAVGALALAFFGSFRNRK